MFSGLEVLVLAALAFVFFTARNDNKALALRLEGAEKELRSLRGYVQAQRASTRDRAAVLQILQDATSPVRLRLRGDRQCQGHVRGITDEQLLLEALPTPYDEGQDPALRTDRVPLENIVAYLDEAGFWQRMPRE